MALSQIKTNSIAADAITSAKIAEGTVVASDIAANSVDSSELVNGSVDLVHMSADSVDSDQYVDGSIDTIHIANNAVTGAKIAMTSDAQGDVMYYNGTDYVRLAPGTSGQFLKTLGASANPAWGTVVTDTSGAWTSGTATTGKALVMGF